MITLRHDFAEMSATEYPTLAANKDAVEDRALSVRWSSGMDRPLTSSFETLLDLLIAGIGSRVPQPPVNIQLC